MLGHFILGDFLMSEKQEKFKAQQPSLTIDEQIANLRSKQLVIEDVDYARVVLNDISYFRLIKAYSLGLKEKNGNYYEGIRFENIVQLYLFDSNFRQVLFPQIEKVEINLRCRLSNYFSDKYGVLGYEEESHFAVSTDVFQAFYTETQNEINRNSRKPFIKNFKGNYVDGKVPLYALVEVMSFGTLSKFYKNMNSEDKKNIALAYGLRYPYLESWLENLSYVRNICAHYGRLYNAKMTKTPRLYKQHAKEGIPNNRIFATLTILKYLLPSDRHWRDFIQTLEILTEKYPSVRRHCIGFPQDWAALLSTRENKDI